MFATFARVRMYVYVYIYIYIYIYFFFFYLFIYVVFVWLPQKSWPSPLGFGFGFGFGSYVLIPARGPQTVGSRTIARRIQVCSCVFFVCTRWAVYVRCAKLHMCCNSELFGAHALESYTYIYIYIYIYIYAVVCVRVVGLRCFIY